MRWIDGWMNEWMGDWKKIKESSADEGGKLNSYRIFPGVFCSSREARLICWERC